MSRLHDALEACLVALEQGRDINSALKGYAELDAQLRPMLETALAAREAAAKAVPPDMKRRGRVRFLQQAAQLREAGSRPRQRMIPALPRLAISFSILAILVLTSTGLVSASSSSLPGEQLYGIKRSWEDLRLFFVFQPQERYVLQNEFEQERLDEIDGLLARRQTAPITFSGLVMKAQDGSWLVSGIPISVTYLTNLPSGPIQEGAPVLITGSTRSDGVVEALRVQVLQPGVALPPLEPSEHGSAFASPGQEESGTATPLAPVQSGTPSPATNGRLHSYVFTGIVESMGNSVWRINGQTVYLDQPLILGSVKVGTQVTFEGYYSTDGRYVVTRIQVQSTPSSQGAGSESGSGGNSGSGSGGGSGSGSGGGGSDDGKGDGGSSD